MRHIVIKLIMPAAMLAFGIQIVYFYLRRSDAPEKVSALLGLTYNVVVLGTSAGSFVRAGRATQNWFFGTSMVGITALVQLTYNIQVKLLPDLLEGSDAKKAF